MRGGFREGAGRPAVYRGKLRETHAMAFTTDARERLEALRLKTSIGRNDIMEHLLRTYGATLVIPERVEYSPKKYPPVAIRLTEEGRALLLQLAEAYGRSWTDVGETLLRRFGNRTVFPYLPTAHERKAPAPGSRRRRQRPTAGRP